MGRKAGRQRGRGEIWGEKPFKKCSRNAGKKYRDEMREGHWIGERERSEEEEEEESEASIPPSMKCDSLMRNMRARERV